MGGVVRTTKDEWSAWTGGKPNADWTGLDASAEQTLGTPNQLRSLYVKSSQASFHNRTVGLEVKFVETADFTQFTGVIWRKWFLNGMDTIIYLPAPDAPTEMLSIVTHHPRFMLNWATTVSQLLKAKFDMYDRANDHAAKEFLLDSLSPNLQEHLLLSLEPSFPFVIVWMRLVWLVTSTSIVQWDAVKKSIRGRLPSLYPGENILQLSLDFEKDAKKLTIAGHYDHHLTSDMLHIFLLSGGDSKQGEEFRHPLRNLNLDLEAALQEVTFMEKAAALCYLSQKQLLYTDVCKKAEELYWAMKDDNRWEPARHASDSKAV